MKGAVKSIELIWMLLIAYRTDNFNLLFRRSNIWHLSRQGLFEADTNSIKSYLLNEIENTWFRETMNNNFTPKMTLRIFKWYACIPVQISVMVRHCKVQIHHLTWLPGERLQAKTNCCNNVCRDICTSRRHVAVITSFMYLILSTWFARPMLGGSVVYN